MKRAFKWLTIIIIIPGTLFGLFLLFFTLNEFDPPEVMKIEELQKPNTAPRNFPRDLKIATWNIGYCGLDEKMDFVMDGGTKGRPADKKTVQNNLRAVENFLSQKKADIYLLQEVDKSAARSFDINELNSILKIFPNHYAWYAANFNVLFVPSPISEPIGRVNSGILTISKWPSVENKRYQLPGHYSWPVRVFHLKRCMTLIRIKNPDRRKDWCIINLHLSAYDSGGKLRQQQLDFVEMTMVKLYNEGNYVLLGGDWNSQFPGVKNDMFGKYTTSGKNLFWIQKIKEGWTPAFWKWAYDKNVATCRTLDKPYKEGENFKTIIDGFLMSPNVSLVNVKGVDLKFKNSDHNPVIVHVRAN